MKTPLPLIPANLLVIDIPEDHGEPRELDIEETLHRCVDRIEEGHAPDDVAKVLLDATTDDEHEQIKDCIRQGWAAEVAPDRPVGLLCLALAQAGGSASYEPCFGGDEVARILRERDHALAALRLMLGCSDAERAIGTSENVSAPCSWESARREARAALGDAPAPSLDQRIAALVAEGAGLQHFLKALHQDDPRAAAFAAWGLIWTFVDTATARESEHWPADHPVIPND